MRRLLPTLAVPAALAGLAVASGPRVGRVLFAAAMQAESRLAGLRTRRVDVDGLSIAFYEGGPSGAPTVVMVHGYSADRHLWVRFAKHLTKRFHVVVPDLAGHGDTPFVAGADFSAAAQADRVAGLLDALGVERAHVIGNSMGGFTAAAFGLRHPERTLSLCLSDAAGVIAPERNELVRLVEEGRNPFLVHDRAGFADFYAMTMSKPPWAPRPVLDAMAADYVARRDQLAEIHDGFFDTGLLDDRLGEIAAPTLVTWGSEDRIVDPSAADVWVEGLPNARQLVYHGVGHMPMVEIPRRSAKDYVEFLDSV